MSRNPLLRTDGPFRVDQLKPGDPYELTHGHPTECLPSGGRHSKANLTGGLALSTDPAVDSAGVDTGFAPDPKNLRAPDIAVGNVPDQPGWVEGAPPLAVEYADTGQDEQDLRDKIETLLGAGTRYVWVVRMAGPRRVEVHEPGKPARTVRHGERIEAPGVLRNPLPVEALYDPNVARTTALRNLLQRHGYADLGEVKEEGRAQGRIEGRVEGRAEGRVEGHVEGQQEGRSEQGLTMALRLLQRRLGDLSPANEQRVRHLTLAQLESLAEALLDFRAAADLDHWLDNERRSG